MMMAVKAVMTAVVTFICSVCYILILFDKNDVADKLMFKEKPTFILDGYLSWEMLE